MPMMVLDVQSISVSGFTQKMATPSSITRHPTMPMTKRDSLVITGSRLSLISTGSGIHPPKPEHKDNPAGRSDFVTNKRKGQKSPKKVKRTDSYKKALNRQSIYDNLDDVVIVAEPKPTTRREDRQKYNTLPIKPSENISNGESNRKKRPSGDKSRDGGEIHRNVSQKSGTYPSPDTDEDQHSTQPERKKKSAFKRFKERFVSTMKRDRDSQSKRKDKPQTIKQSSAKSGRVGPNDIHTMSGFHTPAENSAKGLSKTNGYTREDGIQTLPYNGENEQESKKSGSGFFSAIRRSFRRKQSPPQLRSKKVSSDSRSGSTDTSSSPRGGATNTGRTTSAPRNIPQRPENIDESFETTDPITELFGSIIDRPKVDRSNLRLELKNTCRPISFERPVSSQNGFGFGYQTGELSPTVDIDGLDFADGLPDTSPPSNIETEEELTFQEVSQGEKQRRVDDVARCLAAIGDKIAAEKAAESAGSSSEVEGHRVGLTAFERSLREDLLHYADREFSFGQNGINVSINLMPVVKNILAAPDYTKFKHVIKQELSHTNGWDQVAWYTYLINTTVCLAETKVGTTVRNRATKYFKSVFQPWIASRPNGWESIHEETDVDTELD